MSVSHTFCILDPISLYHQMSDIHHNYLYLCVGPLYLTDIFFHFTGSLFSHCDSKEKTHGNYSCSPVGIILRMLFLKTARRRPPKRVTRKENKKKRQTQSRILYQWKLSDKWNKISSVDERDVKISRSTVLGIHWDKFFIFFCSSHWIDRGDYHHWSQMSIKIALIDTIDLLIIENFMKPRRSKTHSLETLNGSSDMIIVKRWWISSLFVLNRKQRFMIRQWATKKIFFLWMQTETKMIRSNEMQELDSFSISDQ